MIMDLERWNKELEDHDLFQPIINDLPNFCETTHETDLENDTLLLLLHASYTLKFYPRRAGHHNGGGPCHLCAAPGM